MQASSPRKIVSPGRGLETNDLFIYDGLRKARARWCKLARKLGKLLKTPF